MSWKKVGEIGVDAGLCMVGDPCYASYPDHPDHPIHNWDKFCESLKEHDKQHPQQATAMQIDQRTGVVVSTGYGDGIYPVFARYNADGRIVGLKVDFDV